MKNIKNSIIHFIKEEYKFLLLIVGIFLFFYIELPYKVYTPGGMVDLKSRVKVENGYPSSGILGMSYVSLVRGSIPYVLLSKIIPDWDLVSEEDLKYDNETLKERMEADKIATQESIDRAIIASYTLAGKEVNIDSENIFVTYIDEKANTNLKVLDQVLEIDSQPFKTAKELKNLVEKHQIGEEVDVLIKKDGKEEHKKATVFDLDGPKIGIAMTITYNYDEEPKATIEMKQSESGPSGGLMMALALYNSLVEEDITKGKTIVGTGTIDTEGNVGSIGGVKYKLIGAVNNKAEIFLVPKENYEEAMKIKEEKNYNINIIEVSNLKEAVDKIQE